MNYLSDIGIQMNADEPHCLMTLDSSETVEIDYPKESIFKAIIKPFLYFVLKITLCLILMAGLLAGYFYLVVLFGADKPPYNYILSILAGLSIAMLTLIFWEYLSEWLDGR